MTQDFEAIIKQRRSANKFIENIAISEAELEEIFSLVKFAPSAFNLQHTHYVTVTDGELKEQLYEAANKQYKVKTASGVIAVLGSTEAHLKVRELNEGLVHLGVLSQQEVDTMAEATLRFYEERGETFKRDEAIRNASLSAMQFMLAAKAKGWDTCPMIGFDPEKARAILNIPDQYIPVMLITIGKQDTSSLRPRGYRKPVREFVTQQRF
ncbi:nitroreductase family protein [Paenibacillus thiaminolyticus]|uniref:Nitroreductase family protein n=1 Tax=Paenibacillus thiaminolyticus TaxID=49283 RepID=A0A3A3GHB1_PANTH|nr:nitroreductase family protein [Paenibacillus thiaminolyticus]RJG23741.1 nitroreductase family protein [Paenibacillus thiaminolyticus]